MQAKFKQPIGDPIEREFEGETAVLIATGPSVSQKQVNFVYEKQQAGKCKVITINNAYQVLPSTNVHISCNDDWWTYYWSRDQALRELSCAKYTWYKAIANQLDITYIKAVVKDGLSEDPRIIHINHGSGPMAINLALHYGVKRLLLIGHDMKFAANYNGKRKKAGSSSRHYFGEYPKKLQHWPSVKVGKTGTLNGLITAYDTMVPQIPDLGMEVINCTPKSALTTFPLSTLEKEL